MFRIVGAHGGAMDGRVGEGTAFTSRSRLSPIPSQEPMSWVGSQGWDRWGLSPGQIESVVTAVRYGWNVTGIHNEGDAASERLLQAFEEGRKKPIVPSKHQRLGIDHWLMARQIQFGLKLIW